MANSHRTNHNCHYRSVLRDLLRLKRAIQRIETIVRKPNRNDDDIRRMHANLSTVRSMIQIVNPKLMFDVVADV